MADEEQLAVLRQGSDAWNAWRKQNPNVPVNLSRANLRGADLRSADLSGADADLTGAILSRADLTDANLSKADLAGAQLIEAFLLSANLSEAKLVDGHLGRANLSFANLIRANLSGASLSMAELNAGYLQEANLSGANLYEADLYMANLTGANLTGANLIRASLVGTNFTGATLTGCRVYGISAWNGAKQENLIITPPDEPEITVDNLEVAQFLYLLLNNKKIREVIDTITSKVVLILGRFTDERKVVLYSLREELRKGDYTPVLFDFDKPASQDLLGTVETLARMARFVIADITEASSVPAELQAIVPHLRTVPVQPLLRTGAPEYALFAPLKAYPWVLELFEYGNVAEVLSSLARIISRAEAKARELRVVAPSTGRAAPTSTGAV